MSTRTATIEGVVYHFAILPSGMGFEVLFRIGEGTWNTLRDRNYQVRHFSTRNSARKRISREVSGNFHK